MADSTTAWAGEFGDAYTARNASDALAEENKEIWRARCYELRLANDCSVLELGCNRGLNLAALRELRPCANLQGIEVNINAAVIAEAHAKITRCRIQDYVPFQQFDLVFTRGVLIHIPPGDLPAVYDLMYAVSRRYILISEYFNPEPVEVTYRGNAGMLWKRDFARELLERHPDLKIHNYGFHWSRDHYYAHQDNLTWFVLKKDLVS